MRTSRPLTPIAQLSMIILLIGGALFFIYFAIIPFISQYDTPEISQGVITISEGGICEVMTDDETAPSKIITNCYLEKGTNVSISYQKGLQYANINSQK